MLPPDLKASESFYCRLTDTWRYYFGSDLRVDGIAGARGTLQAPFVESLVLAVFVAERWLAAQQLQRWLSGFIGDPAKHYDALVEMLFVCRVAPGAALRYELDDIGAPRRPIDWMVSTASGNQLLVEVKHRSGVLAEELERIAPHLDSNDRSVLDEEPAPDWDRLFADTWEKFLPIESARRIQGVALFLNLKVPASGVRTYFDLVLRQRLHFVCLVNDQLQGFVHASRSVIKRQVLEVFRIRESMDLVF